MRFVFLPPSISNTPSLSLSLYVTSHSPTAKGRHFALLFGGLDPSRTPSQTLYKLDMSAAHITNWEPILSENSPPARAFHVAEVLHSSKNEDMELVIFGGGISDFGTLPSTLDGVWAFNVDMNKWRQVLLSKDGINAQDIPSRRVYACSVAVPGKSGHPIRCVVKNFVHVFFVLCSLFFCAFYLCLFVSFRNSMLISGGRSAYEIFNDLYSYDHSLETTFEIQKTGIALTHRVLGRSGDACAIYDNQLVLFGGADLWSIMSNLMMIQVTCNAGGSRVALVSFCIISGLYCI